jgi:ATP-dependent helicase/nuclease subunit A
VWAGAKINDVAPVAAARARRRLENEAEHRRLLYVAMTRAIDRLVVCGAEGERARPEGCWWNLVFDALKPVASEEAADDGDGKVWRYRPTPPQAGQQATTITAEAVLDDVQPAWLERDVTDEPASALPLSPSRAYDDEAVPVRRGGKGSAAEREKAMARGVLMHRLLQSLPDVPPRARMEAARAHLARNGKTFSPEEREAMIEEVGRVLNDLRFSGLFLPGSRAEVPIVGRYQGRPISGLVDRLAFTTDAVLIADFKTNKPAPRRFEDVPTYVRQLALYRAVLAQLYPDKAIRAALIWTDVPDLMEIPATAMDRELICVTSP